MKQALPILFLFFSVLAFSQVNSNFNFQKYSQPDSKNELSIYLKKSIPKYLLNEAKFPNKKGIILLSFSFNNEMEMYNIKTTTYNRELNDAIVEAFKKYSFEKLNIDTVEQNKNYTLQIISKKNGRNIFNCSSEVIIDMQPVCKNCEDLMQYEDIKKCLIQQVEKHFFGNFNFNLVKSSDLKIEKKITVKFKILKTGQLIPAKSKSLSKNFLNELDRVLKTFPELRTLRIINEEKRNNTYSFSFYSNPNETPKPTEKYSRFNNYTKPNTENKLSNYFSKNLTEELIAKSNLNSINRNLILSFQLDKKNNPINIITTARSKELDKELITLFKNYPQKELPFLDKNPLNYMYSLQVLSYTGKKTIINCNSNIGYFRTPIYKGCEKSKNSVELKKCLNTKIKKHIAQKFNIKPYIGRIDLKGEIKIYCQLRFEKGGDITVLGIRSPHPLLKVEALRVINLMPKLTAPGYQNGSPVNVTYMLPISVNLN